MVSPHELSDLTPALVAQPIHTGPGPTYPQANNPQYPVNSQPSQLEARQAAEARAALVEQMIEASKEGNVAVAHALLLQDPTLASCRDSVGQSPLMWAAYKGYTALAVLLIQTNAPVDDHDCQSSRSALYMACEFGNWPVASLLLQHGANPSFRRQLYGRTCLQIAAYNNHAHVVQGVLAFAASCPPSCPTPCVVDVNAVDNHGSTALHLAIREDPQQAISLHPSNASSSSFDISDTVRVLLSWGADPLIPNLAGALPVTAAQRLQHAKCLSLLTGWERMALVHKARLCVTEARQMEAHVAMEFAALGRKEEKRQRNEWGEVREEETLPDGWTAVPRQQHQRSSSNFFSSFSSISMRDPKVRMGGKGRKGREGGRDGPSKPSLFTLGLRQSESISISSSSSSSSTSSSSSSPNGQAISLSLSGSGATFYSLPSLPSIPITLPVLEKPRPPSFPPSFPPYSVKGGDAMGVSGAGGLTCDEGGREEGRTGEQGVEGEGGGSWECGRRRLRMLFIR
ncbi:ankyrin repeat-containing protein [Nannochloropsis oceanica]